MTDKELLKKASDYQTFQPGSGSWNEYNGLDDLTMGSVQDDKIYALVHDGQLADLEKGNPTGIEYFFDQATYDKYVDPATGEFDAQGLSQSLQVKPFQSDAMALSDGHAEYRNSIACFDVNGDIRTPVGICEANTQFGGGGAHEAFIPGDESKSLQASGTLKYNSSASNIHTGQNYIISADDYNKIQASSDERCLNCENKGLAHPEPAACQNGFKPNNPIAGEPFDSNGQGIKASSSVNHNQSGGRAGDPQLQTPGQGQTGLQSQVNGQNQIPEAHNQHSLQGLQPPSQHQDNKQDQTPTANSQQNLQGQQPPSQHQDNKQGQMPTANSQQNLQGQQPPSQHQDNKQDQMPTANSQQNLQGQQPPSQHQDNKQGQMPTANSQQNLQGQQPPSQHQDNKQGQMPTANSQQSLQGNQPGTQDQQSKQGEKGTSEMPLTSASGPPQETSKESVRNQNSANDPAGHGESASQGRQGPDNKSQENDHLQPQNSSSGMPATAAGSGGETNASSGMSNRAAGQSGGEEKPSSSSQSNHSGMSV